MRLVAIKIKLTQFCADCNSPTFLPYLVSDYSMNPFCKNNYTQPHNIFSHRLPISSLQENSENQVRSRTRKQCVTKKMLVIVRICGKPRNKVNYIETIHS